MVLIGSLHTLADRQETTNTKKSLQDVRGCVTRFCISFIATSTKNQERHMEKGTSFGEKDRNEHGLITSIITGSARYSRPSNNADTDDILFASIFIDAQYVW